MSISKSLVAHAHHYQRLTELFRQKKLTNTLLFSGQKSVGKFTSSLALSQYILCEQKSACGQCGSCLRVRKQQHESLLIVQAEKGLIKVDQSRQVIQFLSKKLNQDEYKIVIIDGAESLNNQSANALLKTLEEPPENCFIILIAHSLYALLTTVRSRCQIYRFGSLSKEQIMQVNSADEWLVDFSENNLNKIEELAEESTQAIYMSLSDSLLKLMQGSFVTAVKEIESVVKSKKQCLMIIQALQLFIKKSYFQKMGLSPFVLDWQQATIEQLQKLSTAHLFILFNESIKMEYEFSSNFDMLLSFESFYKKVLFFNKEVPDANLDRYSHAP